MRELNNYIKKKIEEKRFTSYNISVLKKGRVILSNWGGYSVLTPEKIKTTEKTVYDLASVTKPLATSLLVGILIDKGILKLEDKIKKYFPKVSEDKKNINLRQLLTHTSGLISWKPLYYKGQNFNVVLEEALNSELEKEPGVSVIYSCLNYIIIKGIIEKATGESYISLFNKNIKTPLKLHNTFFNPPEEIKNIVSATEEGNGYEKEKALNIFKIKIPERKGIIWGQVHDSNSFFSGGTAGNAGLFSTAREVSKIALEFLPETKTLLKTETLNLFYENFTPFSSVHRSIGFILKTTTGASVSDLLSEKTIYHLGFTGTDITIDLQNQLIITILLNRVHPIVREPTPKDILKKIQDIIIERYV